MASEFHHAKAQTLLQQIDFSKRQRDTNEDERNCLLDTEDRMLHLYRQLYVQRMHHDVNYAMEEARSQLQRFEEQLSYSHSTMRLEAARFVAECDLKATADMLVDDNAICSLRAVDNAADHMKRLISEYPDGDVHLRRYMSGALDVLHKAAKLVQQMKIESDGWLPVTTPVMQALEQLVKCRPIEEPLSKLVAEIKNLTTEDVQLQQRQREAGEQGDVAKSEELSRDRVMVLEGISDLVTHQFRVISNIEEGTLKVLVKETARIRNATVDNSAELLKETEAKRAVLKADLDRVRDQRNRAQGDQSLARNAFLEAKQQSDAALKLNAAKQHECWEKMLQLERELQRLAVDRRDEVDRRIRMVEREERRRCDMQHFEAFAVQHEEVLSQSLKACEAEEELGHMMREVVLQCCAAVDVKVLAMQRTLENTRVSAFTQHSEVFRTQYLHLGDIMYRKERLIDELDRRIAMLNTQQDMAMQTFDPKAKHLSEQRAELEVERNEVQQFLEELQAKASAYVEAFKPTEKALRQVAHGFVHPIFELQRANKERSRKLDHYYAAVVLDTESQMTAKQIGANHRLIASSAELEAERELIAEARKQPRVRNYVGRDGQLPTVDKTKKSDFNPLGFHSDAEAKPRRGPPRVIKGRHRQSMADVEEVDLEATVNYGANGVGPDGNASPNRTLADRLRETSFGLPPHLEQANGRALVQLNNDPSALD